MTLNIYQKLIEVRKVVPYIQKADIGAQYAYTGSSRVLAAVKDKMDELGLLLVPSVTGHNLLESAIEFRDANGNATKRTTTYFTELEMTMTWINAEKPDERIVSGWYGQGVDIAGEKGVGKALTYAEKYFILKFFNIPTDKDDPDSFQARTEPKDPTEPAPPVADVPPIPPVKPPAEKKEPEIVECKMIYKLIKENTDGFDDYYQKQYTAGRSPKQILDGLKATLEKKEKEKKEKANEPVG
jgi:hypothetical protein